METPLSEDSESQNDSESQKDLTFSDKGERTLLIPRPLVELRCDLDYDRLATRLSDSQIQRAGKGAGSILRPVGA